MDGSRFDYLTRQFVSGGTRRGLLRRALAGAIAIGAGARSVATSDAAATCRASNEICRKHGDCCSNLCGPKDRSGRQRCYCPEETVVCDGACANLQTDADNCGACGVVCPTIGCAVGVCSNGQCSFEENPEMEGLPCSDGNLCTINDICIQGACVGQPVDCSGLSDGCNDGVCGVDGECFANPLPNESECTMPNSNPGFCMDGDCIEIG